MISMLKAAAILALVFVLGGIAAIYIRQSGRYQIVGDSNGGIVHRLDTSSGDIETFVYSREDRKLVRLEKDTSVPNSRGFEFSPSQAKQVGDELLEEFDQKGQLRKKATDAKK